MYIFHITFTFDLIIHYITLPPHLIMFHFLFLFFFNDMLHIIYFNVLNMVCFVLYIHYIILFYIIYLLLSYVILYYLILCCIILYDIIYYYCILNHFSKYYILYI